MKNFGGERGGREQYIAFMRSQVIYPLREELDNSVILGILGANDYSRGLNGYASNYSFIEIIPHSLAVKYFSKFCFSENEISE